MSDERITTIVNNLSSLILHHSNLVASAQHAPSSSPDEDDRRIAEHRHWVKELRELRKRFEDLVTGAIP